MPSMHAAYPLLAALYAFRLFRWRALPLFAYTGCVWLSIVYLGEHYVVDIMGGVVFVAAAYLGDEALARWWAAHRLRRPATS